MHANVYFIYQLIIYINTYIHITYFMHVYGEGNDNPLQYSCLETPMDGGAC